MPEVLCRRCGEREVVDPAVEKSRQRCRACGAPNLLDHPELFDLTIAHLDCDAFFAAVEKRDDPSLVDKPVIIGGGQRGVVSTACYIARTYGIHSAQPMFKALKACPHAVVIKPNMAKYAEVGHTIRRFMEELTPLVEPLSIDEAFLDLSGTERVHRASPAETMVRLQRRIEKELGVTGSVGLSHCKFLAKMASDFDKPKGFKVIGQAETLSFLAEQPVSLIWGVGKAFERRLHRDGLYTIGQLQRLEEKTLIGRYGEMGSRLFRLSRGLDARHVTPRAGRKSLSAETTFETDLRDLQDLQSELWGVCEKVARRAREEGIGGSTVTLKLKTAGFRSLTRAKTLPQPAFLADTLYLIGQDLLRAEVAEGARSEGFRLIGIGLSALIPLTGTLARTGDLFAEAGTESGAERAHSVETAMDKIRDRFGLEAIAKGRGLNRQARRARNRANRQKER